MKQFRLSRQPNPPGSVLTKFHVLDGASIIGSINVRNEEADDLQKYWLQPQASAAVTPTVAKRNAMLNAMLKRPVRLHLSARGKQENPMVSAMAATAKRNRLTKQAVLRGC